MKNILIIIFPLLFFQSYSQDFENIRTEYDELYQRTTYYPRKALMNDDAFYIYLVKTRTGKLNLRLRIQRFGIYPIDISGYIVETDLGQERIIPNSGEIDRGASNRLYKSIYDVLFTRKIYDIIDKVVKSENSKLRYMGKRDNDWKTIKEKERDGIKDILALYTALGGKFDY